jgi:hypothetical protein
MHTFTYTYMYALIPMAIYKGGVQPSRYSGCQMTSNNIMDGLP